MREIPPTAGLPLRLRDLLPGGTSTSLAAWIATLLQVDAVEVTCSGTAALVVALRTLAADSTRREVVVPAYTCPLVPMAVQHCGLVVRVCDLDPSGLAMEPAQLAGLVGKGTLAVVPTYLGGRVHDIDPVLRCAQAAGAYVIEDAAQALGARHAGGIGAGLRGDIGIYSLAAGKGLTMYEGGALATRHAHLRGPLAATARALPWRPGWELRRGVELLGYAALYRPRALGVVYGAALRRALRRGDAVAAAGDVFHQPLPLHRPAAWRQAVAARAAVRWAAHDDATRRQAAPRIAALRALGIEVFDDAAGARGTWPVLLARLPSAGARDAVLRALWGAGVGIGVPFARALPDYPDLGLCVGVPVARDFAARVLQVSNSPWLDDATFARILACIERAVTATAPAAAPG